MSRKILPTLVVLLSWSAAAHAQVTFQRLLNASAEPQNWLSYSGGYTSQRHSSLRQIRPANVKELERLGLKHPLEL